MPQKKIYTKEEVDSKLGDKLNIANTTYIFGETEGENKFNLMELGVLPARTRAIQFSGNPSVDPVINIVFGNGNGLNVHFDSLKRKVNNTEYDLLDSSMALTEAELNEILV